MACDGAFAVGGHHFVAGEAGEGVAVGAEGPHDAVGEVLGIAVAGDVAVGLVVDHLGDATDVEADAGGSAGEGFHDGVGEVVLQGRGDVEVNRVVELHHLLGFADVGDGMDGGLDKVLHFLGIFPHHHDAEALGDVGILQVDDADGFGQIREAFALVGDALTGEEEEVLVERQAELHPGQLLVERLEEVGVDGVGDAEDGMPLSEEGCPCEVGNPLAASDEGDGCVAVDALLLLEDLLRNIDQEAATDGGTLVATGAIADAVVGIVTDAREVPSVVHGDDDGFAGMQHLVEVGQGEKTLVDPVEVDDISPLELTVSRHVGAGVGDIDGEEVLAVEAVGEEDAEPFPQELDGLDPTAFHGVDGDAVGLLVAHEHLGAHAILLQCLHQTVSSNGRTADALGCIDDEYSHVFENRVQRYGKMEN